MATRFLSHTKSRPRSLSLRGLSALALCVLVTSPATAFPHVAQPGETLASLAERFYGRIQMERVLATANALDGTTTSGLTPGMILEVPAVTYRQVHEGETWKSLAAELLGAERRYILLAEVNGHKPWIEPELGQLIVVPYNLSWIATGKESLATLAYRFLGSTKHAFQLVQYNDLGERQLERGEVLLLPLSTLPLTSEGQATAERAASQMSEQAGGDLFKKQQDSGHEAKLLADDVRGGRYVSAVARGTELLAAGRLTQAGRIQAHFALLEAYVALDARGLARSSCEAWRSLSPKAVLDPLTTSPKIVRVCEKHAEPQATEATSPNTLPGQNSIIPDNGATPPSRQ